MGNISDRPCRENQKHILFQLLFFFFLENCAFLCDNLEKYGWARQPIDDNMAYAHYILDN